MDHENDIAGKRIFAFIIDFISVGVIQAIGFMCITLMYQKSGNLVDLLLIYSGFSSLLLIFKDVVKGQSIGKRIMKIAVRKMENTSEIPGISTLLLRNLFLVIWPIELKTFFSSKNNLRLGDKLLKTTVIKIKA